MIINEEPAGALTRHQNITAMVAVYEATRAEIIEGFACFKRACELYESFSLAQSIDRLRIRTSVYSHHTIDVDSDALAAALDGLKRQTWSFLVERLELRRMMSVARWEEMRRQLDKGDLPEISVESVSAWGVAQRNSIGEMAQEKIVEVHDWLRPRNDHYKTNSRLEIGPRVIKQNIVEVGWSGKFQVSEYHRQELIALETVFSALDGKGNVAKAHKSELQVAIEACTRESNAGQTDYFAFSCHKNKNLHIAFRRADLLARFNQLAGGKRLRPNAEAA